jgi:hypothetical protein
MPKKPHSGPRLPVKQTAENRAARQTGTDLATSRYNTSCNVVSHNVAGKGTWGGARNRAERQSDKLQDDKIGELISAANFALTTGRTFQRHWIVHYGKAGIAEHDATRFIGKLLDLLNKQARRAGGELSAIWVREMASGYGGHVHLLIHLPPGLLLQNRTRRWIKAAGGTCKGSVSLVKRIGGRLPKAESFHSSTRGRARDVGSDLQSHRRANAENVVRYLLKSASPETGERLGLKYHGRGGTVIGKRCGSTQNIGKTARLRQGATS